MSLSFLGKFGTLSEKDRGNAVESTNRIPNDVSSEEKPLVFVGFLIFLCRLYYITGAIYSVQDGNIGPSLAG